MKKFANRFSVMIWAFVCVLLWCAFISGDAYVNAVVIILSVFGMIVGYCHIEKDMNESEKRFINKLDSWI